MRISRDSNYAADKDTVQTFLSGLGTVQSTFNSSIKSQQEVITSLSFESWTDEVGQSLKARIKHLKDNDFNTIESDITGGAFQSMKNNAQSLINSLDDCIKEKTNIENATQKMKDAEYTEWVEVERPNGKKEKVSQLRRRQPDYNNAQTEKDEAEKALDNAIETSNNLIDKFPTFHFNGSVSSDGDTTATATTTSMPKGTSKTQDGMVLVDEFAYTDEFNDTHNVQMLIDPKTGNRIVVTEDGYMYVVTRDVDVVFDGVMYIDGEATYTYEAPIDTSDPNAVRDFLQSQESREYLTDPKSKNPAEERTFQGDRLSTNEMHTGDGETRTVQMGDDSVTFFTAENAAADQAFNAWMDSNMNTDLFNVDNYK